MCPALVFATRRTAKVPGRTEILTPSTQDRKGASHPGIPEGRIPPVNLLGEKLNLDIIIHNHNGKLKTKQKTICLEYLKL